MGHHREPRAEAAPTRPKGVEEGTKAAWTPPGQICSHPDINSFFLEVFGSLTELYQQISESNLICHWFPRGCIWSSNFSDLWSENAEKALLRKRDSSGHKPINWIQGIFPTENLQFWGENANNFRHFTCFTRNLNYFKFQHLLTDLKIGILS